MEKYPQGLKMFYEKKTSNDDEEYFNRPNNLRELALDQHLMPFLMAYIKEMPSEITIMIHPKAVEFLKQKELTPDDFKEISDENLGSFKEIFKQNLVSSTHKKTLAIAGDSAKILDQLLDHFIDIKANRVPVENNNVKIDQIYEKVVFLTIPDDTFIEETIIKEEKEQEDGSKVVEERTEQPNTGESAVIVLQVPQIEETINIPMEVTGDQSPKMETITKKVDEDQEGKCIAIQNCLIENLKPHPENYFAITEIAGKIYR